MGIASETMNGRVVADNPRALLWLVIALCLPTLCAFLIVVSAVIHPNMLAYFLIPLTLIAPVCLLSAIVITFQHRQSMPRQLLRFARLTIFLAIATGVAAITIVRIGMKAS